MSMKEQAAWDDVDEYQQGHRLSKSTRLSVVLSPRVLRKVDSREFRQKILRETTVSHTPLPSETK
jgi:hypothetical protein